MNRMIILLVLVILCGTSVSAPARILFVGNSYTFANGGLGLHLRGFYSSAVPGDSIETLELTAGGATLQNHWNNPQVTDAIAGGTWDMVVMQEQSTRPVVGPTLMFQYADSLGDLAVAGGVEPAFLMTWARMNDPEMIVDLEAAYRYAASLSGALALPVGLAFSRSAMESPEILLYESDGSHPNSRGTYLAVCVLYAFIWGDSPVGVEYVNDPSITVPERLQLQTTAWNTFLTSGRGIAPTELQPL